MSTHQSVVRDERTVAVENASYGGAYAFLTYALLIDVMYRGLFLNEAAWDLMALVIAGGAFTSAYQARQKTLPRGWVFKAVLVAGLMACLSAVVAAIAAIATGR